MSLNGQKTYSISLIELWFLMSTIFFSVNYAAVDYFDNDLAKVCRPIDQPLDILFILDGSGSVESSTFATQLQMLNRVVDMIDIGEDKSRIAVMQYASYTYIEFLFKAFKEKAMVREAIKAIKHKLGTTKTGKALDKAIQIFGDPSSGSRRGTSSGKQQSIAQVAIVVSDGHSHDNPLPAARRLRDAGVHLIALGIGPHINRNELVEMTGDPELVFENLAHGAAAAHFVETLRMRFAISEACEYSRGVANGGADVRCERNGARVSVTTRAPFGGHFYVKGHADDVRCRWQPNNGDRNSTVGHVKAPTKTPTNISGDGGDELSLVVPYDGCGVQRQFSINPKGIIFEAEVILQFHLTYSTVIDKTFKVHCFYQDRAGEQDSEIDWQLIKKHTQRKFRMNAKVLPCSMHIESMVTDGSSAADCRQRSVFGVGEPLTFKWECNSDNFDIYQSILVHSCHAIDRRTNQRQLIIDSDGCSTVERLVGTPTYPTALTAVSRAFAFRQADGPLLSIECSLRFCDRLMNECDSILPPKCETSDATGRSIPIWDQDKGGDRRRRQAGIPIFIRPLGAIVANRPTGVGSLNEINELPPLVMFDRNRLRLRTGQQQQVTAAVNLPVSDGRPGFADIRLRTEDVRIVGSESPRPVVDVDADTVATTEAPLSTNPTGAVRSEEDESDLPQQIAKTLHQTGINVQEPSKYRPNVPDDPFQESQRQAAEAIAEEERNPTPMIGDLDPPLLGSATPSQILVRSALLYIQDQIPSQKAGECRK